MYDPSLLPVALPDRREPVGGLPFGWDQGRPWALQVWGNLIDRVHDRGRAAELLLRSPCTGCGLGAGLRDEHLRGIHLCRQRVDTLGDLAGGPLDPSGGLRFLRALSSGELRRRGHLDRAWVFVHGDPELHEVELPEALRRARPAVAAERWVLGAGVVSLEALWSLRPQRPRVVEVGESGATAARMRATLGAAAATCGLGDVVSAEVVLLWDPDLVDRQPDLARTLAAARDAGARIVLLAEQRPPSLDATWAGGRVFGARLVDELVAVAPADASVVLAALVALLGGEEVDPAWRGRCPWGQVERLAASLRGRSRVVSLWSGGRGPERVDGLVALHRALGATGGLGAGLIPFWPHAGVQGAIDLGLLDAPGPAPDDVAVVVGDPGTALSPDALEAMRLRVHLITHLDRAALRPPAPGGQVVLLPVLREPDVPGGVTFTTLERRIRLTPCLAYGAEGHACSVPHLVDALTHPEGAWPRDVSPAALRRAIAEALPTHAALPTLREAGEHVQWGGAWLTDVGGPTRVEVAPPRPGPRLVVRPGPLGVEPGPSVGVSAADATAWGLTDGGAARLATERGVASVHVRVGEVAPGVVVAQGPDAELAATLSPS